MNLLPRNVESLIKSPADVAILNEIYIADEVEIEEVSRFIYEIDYDLISGLVNSENPGLQKKIEETRFTIWDSKHLYVFDINGEVLGQVGHDMSLGTTYDGDRTLRASAFNAGLQEDSVLWDKIRMEGLIKSGDFCISGPIFYLMKENQKARKNKSIYDTPESYKATLVHELGHNIYNYLVSEINKIVQAVSVEDRIDQMESVMKIMTGEEVESKDWKLVHKWEMTETFATSLYIIYARKKFKSYYEQMLGIYQERVVDWLDWFRSEEIKVLKNEDIGVHTLAFMYSVLLEDQHGGNCLNELVNIGRGL